MEQMNQSGTTQKDLTHHWQLDELAAKSLSHQLSPEEAERIHQASQTLSAQAIKRRDENRTDLGHILTNNSDLKLAVIGPCSLDEQTDIDDVLDVAETLQNQHPGLLVATRINAAKPRTKGGWTGLWSSLEPAKRQHAFDAMKRACERGVPVVTEVTDPIQFGALAPFLSGVWLGARDATSTSLRNMASVTRLPVGLKNGTDGQAQTIDNAIQAIHMNSDDTESGVDLGTLASSPTSRGVPTGILPVANGNRTLGIIARGHELSSDLSADERRTQTLEHLSSLCTLASLRGAGVIIDGSHDVPPMLQISRKDTDRFPRVMDILLKAIEDGEVSDSDTIRGVMCEMGPHIGRTDPNWVISNETVDSMDEILTRLEKL